jgi:signal transduction histidine kinase
MQAAVLSAVWVPILLFWVVLMMVYGRLSFAAALPRAAMTIGSAALYGVIVWQLCSRRPWPQKVRAAFYAGHLLAAALYAIVWTVTVSAIEPLLRGRWLSWHELVSSRLVGGQLVMGVCFYGGIAGITYAIETQRRAQEQERRALQAEAGLVAARLDALRSRLHPHFLFNALHTIAALVRQDPGQAESAVEKLGDMLRYTLLETSMTVPFAREWEFTRRYLEFEQARYGERLTVKSAIDEACHAWSAPAFALQTLVENAVHHSIATRPAGGTIEITARARDEQLHVRVRDDGGDAATSAPDGTHFGLHALRERLNALYGVRAELAIASDPSGFVVSFTLPRLPDEDADDE